MQITDNDLMWRVRWQMIGEVTGLIWTLMAGQNQVIQRLTISISSIFLWVAASCTMGGLDIWMGWMHGHRHILAGLPVTMVTPFRTRRAEAPDTSTQICSSLVGEVAVGLSTASWQPTPGGPLALEAHFVPGSPVVQIIFGA